MTHWSLERKLYGGIGALMGLLLLSGGVALYSLHSIEISLEETAGPISDRIARAADLVRLTADAWSGSQGAILSAISLNGSTAKQSQEEVLRLLHKSARGDWRVAAAADNGRVAPTPGNG